MKGAWRNKYSYICNILLTITNKSVWVLILSVT